MSREENIKIFEDTQHLCDTNDRLKESIKNSRKNQKLILENDDFSVDENVLNKYTEPANIIVNQKRSCQFL